jgi:hypothetical protein
MGFKTLKPDYSKGIEILGGNLKDFPKPYIFLFPNPIKKREIKITILRCPGYPHYWLSFREEDNAIWDAKEGHWVRPWDSDKLKKLRGKMYFDLPEYFEEKTKGFEFISYHACISAAKDIVKRHFLNHTVIWDDFEGDNRSKEREGD